MQAITYAYWSRILDKFCPKTGRVLEIGTPNNHEDSLLTYLASKQDRDYECIGIDLFADQSATNESLPYKLIRGNSNDMRRFPDASFDIVISSSTLEHDTYFWKTLSEVRRILKSGGVFAVLAPGYNKEVSRRARVLGRVVTMASTIDRIWLRGVSQDRLEAIIENSFISRVSTYRYHWGPKDCYRFSEDAFREVVMEGFECVHFESILDPPRLMAVGIRDHLVTCSENAPNAKPL